MTQIEIIGAIMLCTNMRPEQFAKRHGFTPQTLYRVIKGQLRTKNVREIVSREINIPVNEIWPEEETPSSGHNTPVTAGTGTTVPEDGHFTQAD